VNYVRAMKEKDDHFNEAHACDEHLPRSFQEAENAKTCSAREAQDNTNP